MNIFRQPLFYKSVSRTDLDISESGFVSTDETWHSEPLYALYSRLYFVSGGSGMLVSEEESLALEPNYVYLAPCGMKYGYLGTNSVTKLFFHVNIALSPSEADAFANVKHFLRMPMSSEQLEELKRLYFSERGIDHILLKGELYHVVCKFLSMCRIGEEEGQHHSHTVSEAIAYIHTHLTARLTVAEVAAACFCSQTKLSGAFRAEVGQSVARYINELLVSEAQTKLLYTQKTVGEISDTLGFCDQFYFSRLFRRHCGISPTKYRKAK